MMRDFNPYQSPQSSPDTPEILQQRLEELRRANAYYDTPQNGPEIERVFRRLLGEGRIDTFNQEYKKAILAIAVCAIINVIGASLEQR